MPMCPAEEESGLVVPGNSSASPDTDLLVEVKSPGRPGNSGWLSLAVVALPVLNTFGVLMSLAGPYAPVVLVMGLAGFGGGAALGVYVSVKVMQRPWSASCRWAIYGLVGMLVPPCLFLAILSRLAS